MAQYGLTPQGPVIPRQSQILADLQAAFQQNFGATVNLSSSTVFGNLVNIFSEREALLWEALQDDVINGTPAGARGIYVDNLLSLVGLTRLPAQATVTDPTPTTQANGITLFGLVLRGTPGTVIPKGAIVQTASEPQRSFVLDAAVTIGVAVNAVQDIYFTAQPDAGALVLTLADGRGVTMSTPPILYSALPAQTLLRASKTPSTGTFTLTLGEQTTDALSFAAVAADVQAALRKLTGFAQVTVAGAWPQMVVTWNTQANPVLSAKGSMDADLTVVQSISAYVQALRHPVAGNYPFADVAVSAPSLNQWRIAFGAGTVAQGQPSSGAQPQPLIVISANTLLRGQAAVNAGVTTSVTGRAAQGVGTATCTATGASVVPAGALSVIGSSQQGWAQVTNELDALTGRDIETDTEAMARRAELLASPGAGPLAATLGRLQKLEGVTRAIGFQNLTAAALQRVTFLLTPTSGSYSLAFAGGTTQTLAYNATAQQLQAALDALPQSPSCTVTGAYSYGFALDFGGALGGQALPLVTVASDTTGGQLRTSFGRPPKSVEYVVQGGKDAEVASTILEAAAGGIATYGAPVLETTGALVAGSQVVQMASATSVVVGQAIFGQGLPSGALITALSGTQATLSLPALSTQSSVALTINNTFVLQDVGGNPTEVSFTRPRQVPVYLKISLLTDTYNTPGVASSGRNISSKFDPASLQTVEANVIDAVNSIDIGGLITLRGTTGLGSSFRAIPGIVDVTLLFDVVPNPQGNASIRLLADQVATSQSFDCEVSYQ